MVHQAVLDFQNKELTLKTGNVTEDFANKSGDFDILHIEMFKTVVHINNITIPQLAPPQILQLGL